MFSKVVEKLLNNGIVDHVEKCDLFFFFHISSMILGSLNQLQIFILAADLQLRGLLTGLGLLKL